MIAAIYNSGANFSTLCNRVLIFNKVQFISALINAYLLDLNSGKQNK